MLWRRGFLGVQQLQTPRRPCYRLPRRGVADPIGYESALAFLVVVSAEFAFLLPLKIEAHDGWIHPTAATLDRLEIERIETLAVVFAVSAHFASKATVTGGRSLDALSRVRRGAVTRGMF